jgi:allantoicase
VSDFLDLPDLALDGAVLSCNDDFFAEKENLLRPHAAEWREHAYTDRGKWMDGWESRRRREPGYDWAIVRLGLPGRIRGLVIDTAFFRGNFPESASVEACEISAPLDVAALEHAEWTTILPQSKLAGDCKNKFAISDERRFTHLRLNIFPDGGVARLRVHGEVIPDWRRIHALGGPIDLAAMENGAVVESCSDMFFGSRHNLIKPGRSQTMADGWETKRRRGPGHDWALVRLAEPGMVERVEIDTSHFKGNAPGRCLVEGQLVSGAWRELLATPLQPHTRHLFDAELRRTGPVSHVRLSVFPDGGVARLRVWGTLLPELSTGLHKLNTLPADEATAALFRCCASKRWAEMVAQHRPFEDRPSLLRGAERAWWKLDENDWLEAFAAHPKIGDKGGSRWSSDEQRGTAAASEATIDKLAAANRDYDAKFGFVFLICATGRSADEMLAALEQRLASDRQTEIRTAAEEQMKITRLRVAKLLEELA